ncbi:MAG: divalent cation transporter, partial [Thaumarchaeota archaeon]|nr:divalent cation transporter [Nitrososphaerota archaeon]
MEVSKPSKAKFIASGVIPFAFLIVMIAYIFGPGSDLLDFGVPLPEITIEKVDFVDSEIRVTVRNTGPIPVEVVMADVNDRIQPAAIEPDRFLERFEVAVVRIPFIWNVAEPYTIGLTIEDGTRFEREIEAAAPALEPSLELAGFFAIIGTYVGIIPVMIGLLWLPFIKRLKKNKYHFFLALTAGL